MAPKIALTMSAALLLAGCAPRPAPGPPAARTDADLKIALTVRPPSPRQLDPTRFTVALRDGGGHPVVGADARMDIQMPTMDMGQNSITLSPQSPGVYVGMGRFTMAGEWRVTVTIAAGSKRTAQTFPITVQ